MSRTLGTMNVLNSLLEALLLEDGGDIDDEVYS